MRARTALATAAVVVFAGACADLFGFQTLEPAPDAGGPDVFAPDGGSDVVVPACMHVEPPDPPGAGAGSGNAFTFAVQHVFFTGARDGGANPTYGYDLDRHCTTLDPSTASCTPGQQNADDDGGIDDQSIKLLTSVMALASGTFIATSLTDESLNSAISSGLYTVLGRLTGYSGQQNQGPGVVSFAMQSSAGTWDGGAPAFDGNDYWVVDPNDCITSPPSCIPRSSISFDQTYVTNGVLVARASKPLTIHFMLPNLALSGPLAVTLSQATVTATLVPRDAGGYDLADGVLAGRWAVTDMLAAVMSLTVNGSMPLCAYEPTIVPPEVRSYICKARDITADGGDDDTHPCDAVSLGIGFDAVAANIADAAVPFPTPLFPCPDAGSCN